MGTSRGSTVIRMTCCFYISCSNTSDTAFTIDHLWTFASKMPLKTVIFHHFWMWIWHSNTVLLAFILLKNFPSKYTRALGILTRYFCLDHIIQIRYYTLVNQIVALKFVKRPNSFKKSYLRSRNAFDGNLFTSENDIIVKASWIMKCSDNHKTFHKWPDTVPTFQCAFVL